MASSEEVNNESMRQFQSGATRNVDTERIDPEGFLAPSVLARYFDYMHKNRVQKDGKLRDSDNWQLGIPQRAYVKSLWRHFFDLWTRHREGKNHLPDGIRWRNEQLIEDCCALMFNSMGYMFEELKKPKQNQENAKYNGREAGTRLEVQYRKLHSPPLSVKCQKFLDEIELQSDDWGV